MRYTPPEQDVIAVLLAADPDTKDYLLTFRETMARMGEINNFTWDDVNLQERYVILYTRKKKGGDRVGRKIPMTTKLYEMLQQRYQKRDKSKPWVFWHRYWSKKEGRFIEGPYKNRSKIMKTLCKRAGVRYFHCHSLRHFSASVLDTCGVGIGSIQRLLGHSNRDVTERYLHRITDTEREAMRVFGAATREMEESPTPVIFEKKKRESAYSLTP